MTQYIRFARGWEGIQYHLPPFPSAENAFLPSIALVSLSQESGSAADPVVRPGERLREGQLIARGTSPNSSHVHAPIPGVLEEFRVVSLPDGTRGKVAVIRLGGSFDILGRRAESIPWQNTPDSEVLRVLEDKAVLNTFETCVPLAASLRSARKSGGGSLVVRLFDDDPTIALDGWASRERLGEVLEGASIVAKAMDAASVYLVHDEREWKGPGSAELGALFPKRDVAAVRATHRYPAGRRKQILAVLPRARKSEHATVLIDAITSLSAYEAVVRNQPILSRYVAVSGNAIASERILRVRVGTPIGDVFEECGGFTSRPTRIVSNGLLAGMALHDLDTPVTKYMKSLHVLDADACPHYEVRECAHCGRCLHVCPERLDPMLLTAAVEREQFSPTVAKALSLCQQCGCCAVVCPSRIPIPLIIREARSRSSGGNV